MATACGADARFARARAPRSADPVAAVAKATREDVPLLYWTAASWGAAISLAIDRPDIVIDFPSVRALADRALALDRAWNKGALHELMISLDSLPEALGGNPDRAREHFKRRSRCRRDSRPGPTSRWPRASSVPQQERAEFESLLKEALAIDPEKDPSNRLVTLITQRRARALLDQIDEKFLEVTPGPADPTLGGYLSLASSHS